MDLVFMSGVDRGFDFITLAWVVTTLLPGQSNLCPLLYRHFGTASKSYKRLSIARLRARPKLPPKRHSPGYVPAEDSALSPYSKGDFDRTSCLSVCIGPTQLVVFQAPTGALQSTQT